jgi:nitrite reductase/ring-hydroxylating ferredoxin subunit
MRDDLTSCWFPIASSRDLPHRHVFHAQLLGRELAVWRADDDHVNVWENRCLHRGVRLTVGINEGFELKCQYHGWRYANRSAACTYIPAHPADAPARSIRNRRFAAVERHGLVWSGEAPEGEPPQVEGAAPWPLRPVPVHASTERVLMALASDYVFQPNARIAGRHASVAAQVEGFAVTVVARDEEAETTAVFFVQPVEAAITTSACRHCAIVSKASQLQPSSPGRWNGNPCRRNSPPCPSRRRLAARLRCACASPRFGPQPRTSRLFDWCRCRANCRISNPAPISTCICRTV